ncbi:MAG: phage portal protein [Desulfarculus sp.]|nr:phage portal protein [Desulfarculus sp.]
MLFESSAEATVKRALAGGVVAGNRARKLATAKRLDYYQDAQLDHLLADLTKRYADPSRLQPAFVNIVRKVVDLLASTYFEPPRRVVAGTEQDQAIFAEIAEAAGLDTKLKAASRLVKLCKTILIRPVWRNGRMDIDLLTGNFLDVETGDSPEDLRAVTITHWGPSGRVDEITYSRWTPDVVQTLNYRGQVTSEEPNPYGVLPFVPAWDGLPHDDFWLGGGDDLIVIQEAINAQLTALLYTCQQQGFGVGWVKGGGQGGQVTVGPGAMVELPLDGALGFAATEAPIDQILAVIDKLIGWVAVTNGLPAQVLTTEPNQQSGVALLVSNRELQEKRRDDLELWRRYEKAIFSVMRAIWNAHNPGRQLSPGATLSIDFADPRPAVSEKDQAATWQTLLGLGVISPVDVVMERNPDLTTREEALAFLLQLQDENSQLSERKL